MNNSIFLLVCLLATSCKESKPPANKIEKKPINLDSSRSVAEGLLPNTARHLDSVTSKEDIQNLPKINDGSYCLEKDSLDSITVKGNIIVEYYNGEEIDSTTYSITTHHCDMRCKTERQYTYYMVWNSCYILDNINANYFSIIYTCTGSRHTFIRKASSK